MKYLFVFCKYERNNLNPGRNSLTIDTEALACVIKKRKMARVPCASVVSSLMYAMMCTRLYIYYAIGLVSWFQLELDLEYINTSEGKLTLMFYY